MGTVTDTVRGCGPTPSEAHVIGPTTVNVNCTDNEGMAEFTMSCVKTQPGRQPADPNYSRTTAPASLQTSTVRASDANGNAPLTRHGDEDGRGDQPRYRIACPRKSQADDGGATSSSAKTAKPPTSMADGMMSDGWTWTRPTWCMDMMYMTAASWPRPRELLPSRRHVNSAGRLMNHRLYGMADGDDA